MTEGVVALKAAEVIGERTFWKAIGVTGGSPLVVAGIGTELGLGEVGLGLMQPVGRAIHRVLFIACN